MSPARARGPGAGAPGVRTRHPLDGERARSEVESALDRAAALARHTGAGSFEPFVHEERSRLAAVVGDTSAAKRELAEARRLFTEMGATGHAERLARELGS